MKGEHKSKGDSPGSVMGGGKKRESIFGECSLRRGHPGNKSMADTFLGFELDRSTSVLGCPLAGSCPEECIAACLWKAEATTSSSLAAVQSGNCFEFEEKRGMEQECGKKPITFFFPLSLSRLFFCLPLSCFPAHLFIIQSPFYQFMFSPPLQVSDQGGAEAAI